MAYAQGQESFVSTEGQQTPTERYKVLIMDVLQRCINLDIEKKDEEFIRAVDQLHGLMRLYAIHRDRLVDQWNNKEIELKEDIQKIDREVDRGRNEAQKENLKLKTRYKYAKEMLLIIIDMMNNSPIIEKEMEGLFYSPTTLDDYGKIRQRILETKVV